MQRIVIVFGKALRRIKYEILKPIDYLVSLWIFYSNGVRFSSFKCNGIPYIHKSLNATCTIGRDFVLNNGVRYSDLGTNGRCRIEIRDSAQLIIGDCVGMSDATITCHERIEIGNNVLIGVGTQIRDTDNHSLNPKDWRTPYDWKNKKNAPIKIGNNVFIGTNSIILKGVTIGDKSIIGAGSVVSKNIPANEIWAGNPAVFLKNRHGN